MCRAELEFSSGEGMRALIAPADMPTAALLIRWRCEARKVFAGAGSHR